MGLFGGGNKSSNTTTNQYDQRVVNDNSGAGTADNGAVATTVQGSGNTVTDSGAFAIVDKLVSQIGQVATAQTSVARDIALVNTQAGQTYAEKAMQGQSAALAEAAQAQDSAFSGRMVAVLAAAGALLFYVLKVRKK
jgi:hypothetical protein